MQHGDYSRPSGLKIMEDALSRWPDKGSIDAVFSHNDLMALGALQAAERLGRAEEMFFVSIDGDPETLIAIKDERASATAYQSVEAIGRWAAVRVVQKLYGQEIPKFTIIPINVVDKTNVDEYIGLKERIGEVESYYDDDALYPLNSDDKPDF
jgi:ribose transport system substrate-binding protein